MSSVSRTMKCRPEDVFAVLEDGWTYANWVVGAVRIRDVDVSWPAVGSKIHHSIGVWPVLLDDDTEVEEVDAPRVLQLKAKAWPAGEGRVRISCEPAGEQTKVTIQEQAISGPATLMPRVTQDPMLWWRNTEALRRLSFLAEGRARGK